jgi:hypothetical protein
MTKWIVAALGALSIALGLWDTSYDAANWNIYLKGVLAGIVTMSILLGLFGREGPAKS